MTQRGYTARGNDILPNAKFCTGRMSLASRKLDSRRNETIVQLPQPQLTGLKCLESTIIKAQ